MSSAVPLFPLPDFFLFPNAVAPLHVFEARYRQMIDDQLDGPGRIVMGTLLDDAADEESPPVYPVAGIGEIIQHRRLPDGRYVLMLLGLERVRIDEVPSDRLYRQVEVEALEEVEASEADALRLRPLVREAILARTSPDFELPEDLDLGKLADLLAQALPVATPVRQVLFAELDVAKRAERALAEHAQP